MPAAIRPYSIAVAPESSFRNERNLLIWLTRCGPIQRHDTFVPLTRVPRSQRKTAKGFSAIVKARAIGSFVCAVAQNVISQVNRKKKPPFPAAL
jgi:hypothetical protein